MKKSEIIALHSVLSSLKDYVGIRFNLTVSDNLTLLTPLVSSIEKERVRIESIKSVYEFERYKKVIELSDKDDKNNPIKYVHSNNLILYKLSAENEQILDDYIIKLKERHKESLTEYEKEKSLFIEILNTDDSSFVPVKIKEEYLPTNLTTEHTIALKSIIERQTEKTK